MQYKVPCFFYFSAVFFVVLTESHVFKTCGGALRLLCEWVRCFFSKKIYFLSLSIFNTIKTM